MCGIAGLVTNTSWREPGEIDWLDGVAADVLAIDRLAPDWSQVERALDVLKANFDRLMAFQTHDLLGRDAQALDRVDGLARCLGDLRARAELEIETEGGSEELHRLKEELEDYGWQIEREVLGQLGAARRLLPTGLPDEGAARGQRLLAWAVERILDTLDKLEVRGRDSAGISILAVLEDPSALASATSEEMQRRRRLTAAESGQVYLASDRRICRFEYKVANLVGSLGDNSRELRRQMREDALLWQLMPDLESLNILIHTRWASNGIINIANAHPVDGRGLCGPAPSDAESGADGDALFVLNGDVDNYRELLEATVHARGLDVDAAISTDAKILPLVFLLGTAPDAEPLERFREVLRRSDGSLAVVAQHPSWPDRLFLGQKGSGQSLYAGRIANGWFLASELYGMAAVCREAYPVANADPEGTVMSLATDGGDGGAPQALGLGGGRPVALQPEPIGIFSRDIDRKGFDYYIDKEIHEAPDSVRRTFRGKYKLADGGLVFNVGAFGNGPALVERLRSGNQAAIRRIIAVGQGTAAVAAMGIAHLISEALGSRDVVVESAKASELIGFASDRDLDGVLVIAVSQSGTTTDTNRVVDLVRKQGAWVHAIVNRRDSPLVAKADSYLYTSDGRDVEMSVASTKAFYSQVAAGKVIALLFARIWNTLNDEQLLEEIRVLEKLPAKIEDVLAEREAIAASAAELGPTSRYWALVGNGPNRIAAEEIRIKLSELCYKAIPCDFTEDKKHIDLSTEPLTIVVANDLREEVVQDTVKEVSIFWAHNGRPLVLCARGEDRFDPVAQGLIKVPSLGGALDFVLATVAGHLWGIEAAKAIDARADGFRVLRGLLSNPDESTRTVASIAGGLQAALAGIARGEADSALPAREVAQLAGFERELRDLPSEAALSGEPLARGVEIVRCIIEEMSRPIDTIRHQAKTVTVGISRPEPVVPPFAERVLEELGVEAADLREDDRRLLESLTEVVFEVPGALLYEVQEPVGGDGSVPPLVRAQRGFGSSRAAHSRFATACRVRGSKRRVLRIGAATWSEGPADAESILLLPVLSSGTWGCSHIVLLHLDFAPGVALPQKVRLLRQLGHKHADLLELKEEKSVAAGLDEILDALSPRDLVFRSAGELLRIYSETSARVVGSYDPST